MRLFPIISVAMRVAVMAKPTSDNWDMDFSSDPFSSDSDPFGSDFGPKVEEGPKTGKIGLTKGQIFFLPWRHKLNL